MGRGLSPLQRDILGLAYAVNKHTRITPSVKSGRPVDNYRIPTVDYPGPKDLKTSLAIYAIKRIPPSLNTLHGFFKGTPKCKSAKASVSRAIKRLMERNLLIHAPQHTNINRWGYVLTDDGFEIAKDIKFNGPGLADAIELFGMQAGEAFTAYCKGDERRTSWYHNWMYSSYYAPERDDLILRLQDALTVIEVPCVKPGNHYTDALQ
jgi:hypothetical protein